MFSPICQQSISTQVLGSREEKSFYQALRWWWGRSSAGWLEAVEICHVMSRWSYSSSSSHLDASCSSPPSTDWNFSLPTMQCCGAGEIPHLLTISDYLQRESCFPRKPHHVILKCFAEVASLILCLYHQKSVIASLFALSRLRRSQEAVGLPSPLLASLPH